MTSAPHLQNEDPDYRELQSGDHMSSDQFHRIYSKMPEKFRAELVGGIVYVASPAKNPHGRICGRLISVFSAYEGHTPGTEFSENVTVILGDEDEVQPDVLLRILPSFSGQSKDTEDEYIRGAPELVAEVAYSSLSMDLHTKRKRYQQAGVLEYIVACIKPEQLRWFDLQSDCELKPNDDNVFRSHVFPGLWIQPDLLFQHDYHGLMEVLNKGLGSPEHAEFSARLRAVSGN